ncbi:XRN-Two Binding Domain, XTBD,R3H domain,G-patch domain [Cinara cedri]|uniref:XRN-Two Binding Domain, XTBD,R3H domain,G-patch domain n=1 Tax=Cinara cedri TaxID=506608 RepID=A0A5E4MFS2_9HEMI|nr:XRN-Two Binding Domain, XTBD,R3H domain,G-patch domain [Cinara cedri]
MDIDPSWDVDKHKGEHENETHWEYRRKFLIMYKHSYPEDRLVGLSQTFINIEFMGCKYNQPVMELIENLSDCLVGGLRERRKKLFQTKFVKASSDEVSGNNQAASIQPIDSPYHPEYILPGFIIIENNIEDPIQILERSCSYAGYAIPVIKYEQIAPSNFKAELYIQNKFIINGMGTKKKLSRKDVFKNCYEYLKPICFTIKLKNENSKEQQMIIDKDELVDFNTETDLSTDTTMINNGVGYKLLKLMGWNDGIGLGKHNQGCVDPIQIIKHPKNVGFGNTDLSSEDSAKEKRFQKKFQKHLYTFVNSSKQKLSFSTELTKEERQIVHTSCMRYNLKAKSYGQSENKLMVISKKPNSGDIFKELINISGHENDYYSLIIPTSLLNVTL